MLRKLMLSTTLGVLIAGSALAQDHVGVADITSTTDLTAVQNTEAAAFWANLDADLQGAIAARLVDRLDEDGVRIEITIDEVELANAFQADLGVDMSLLSGHVRVLEGENDAVVRSFEVTATARQVIPLLPADANITVLSADTPDFYEALVNAFADSVVQNIDG